MKEKVEYFNRDMELREMAFKRELNRWTIAREARAMYEDGRKEGEKIGQQRGEKLGEERGKKEGEKQGKIRAKYEAVVSLFKHNFPEQDTEFLVGLTVEEYDFIFTMLLESKSADEIKEMIQ